MRSAFDYGRLRSWYLAGLRRRIISRQESDQNSMTPVRLIAADRAALEKLVMTSTRGGAKREVQPVFAMRKVVMLSIAIPLVACIPFLLFYLATGATLPPLAVVVGIVLSCLLGGLLSAYLVYASLQKPITELAEHADHLSGAEFEASDEIDRLRMSVQGLANAMAEATERENAIADYALDLVGAVDTNGVIMAISPACVELLGYSPVELVGRKFVNFVVVGEAERIQNFFSSMEKANASSTFECGFKRKNGTIIDLQWKAEWSKTEAALFCVGRDITDQKKLERMRQEFVSMVGHDLKTPLASLGCSLEVLGQGIFGTLNEQGCSLLEQAQISIDRLLRLINELLELQKFDGGMVSLTKEDSPVPDVLRTSAEAVRSFAGKRNIQIEVKDCETIVSMDRDRVTQVVVNLLSNAIKFSPDGGKVTVTADSNPDRVKFNVIDQGPGINEKYHDLIFERFRQVDAADAKHGTGLGLHICKAIVEAHGGHIGIVSKPGAGSTFWFTLPR